MTEHIYIDETKAKSYAVVAVMVPPQALRLARGTLMSLIKPGQRSVHMHGESESRRRQILQAVVALLDVGVTSRLYDAGGLPERTARPWCLSTLVGDLGAGPYRLVFDLDETQRRNDERTLLRSLRSIDAQRRVSFEHLPLSQEPLLTLPDAIAWSWARGGRWRTIAHRLMTGVSTYS